MAFFECTFKINFQSIYLLSYALFLYTFFCNRLKCNGLITSLQNLFQHHN